MAIRWQRPRPALIGSQGVQWAPGCPAGRMLDERPRGRRPFCPQLSAIKDREEMSMPSKIRFTRSFWAVAALAAVGLTAAVQAQQATMSFFVTSVGKGNGADLGGLEGADAHCLALAKAAGSTATNWRAYLSTSLPGGDAGVNARERIGKGPWQNAKGVVIAKSVDDLHSGANNLTKQTAL